MVLYKKKDIRIFTGLGAEKNIKEAYIEETEPFCMPVNGSDFSIGNNLPNWNGTSLLNLSLYLGWELGFASPVCAMQLLDDLSSIYGWHMMVEEYKEWKKKALLD